MRFETITIDGRLLKAPDIFRYGQKLLGRAQGREWTLPLQAFLSELVTHTGALTVHTSGTTGAPRFIKHPRRDLIASARLTADTFGLKPGDRALLCLPCEFIAGRMMVVRAMVCGLDLHVIDPRGSVFKHLKGPGRFRFTAMVPLQLHRAIQEDRDRVDRQFETILLGGGPVSETLVEDLQDLHVKVFHGYGSTETLTHVALRPLNAAASGQEPGSPAKTHKEARHGLFTAIGKVTFAQDPRGCLVVRTPHLSAKEHVTNDIVDLIDDRRFRWLGRVDNVILSGGKKIFPEQLEAKTTGRIPYAHFFTSIPDPVLGRAVLLVIETDHPAEEVVPEVLDRLHKVLSRHELPRRITALRRFQRTETGKVMRELSLPPLHPA